MGFLVFFSHKNTSSFVEDSKSLIVLKSIISRQKLLSLGYALSRQTLFLVLVLKTLKDSYIFSPCAIEDELSKLKTP
jgi:hypothetical protein